MGITFCQGADFLQAQKLVIHKATFRFKNVMVMPKLFYSAINRTKFHEKTHQVSEKLRFRSAQTGHE